MVSAARATATVPLKVTWVPRSWLSNWKDKELFDGFLFLDFNKGSLTGINNARAVAHGLTSRPVSITLADTWRWLQRQPQEAEVRIGYRPKADHSGFEPIALPWPSYLEREKALLAAWHASGHKRI